MLKQRVITALILAPLAVWTIFALSHHSFVAVLGVIFVLAAWEWSRIAGLQSITMRAAYSGLIGVLMGGVFLFDGAMIQNILLMAAVVWWFTALIAVLRYPNGSGFWSSMIVRLFVGPLVLVPSWYAVGELQHAWGPFYVLLLVLLIWGADTGAYFAGRRFGRRKLAPKVSPGKTWEGVIGGMLLALLGSLLVAAWHGIGISLWALFPLVLITVSVSVLGDLLESMFKRLTDIKDSGGILPGHGGVLDRIDSLTAAAPIFLAGLLLLSGGSA